jgi:hypothetical protein
VKENGARWVGVEEQEFAAATGLEKPATRQNCSQLFDFEGSP